MTLEEKKELIELAQAVLQGGMVVIKDHHWSNGCYRNAEVCIYCGNWHHWGATYTEHAKECPIHKARRIIRNLLGGSND